MRDWKNRISSDGASVLNGEGFITNGEPGEDAVQECKQIGCCDVKKGESGYFVFPLIK